MPKAARVALLILALAPRAAKAQADATALAQQGQSAYEAGDFGAAVDAYATLTWSGGSRDADVWYNAGNAYAQAEQRGAAVAAYRTALTLAPRHADAAANLAYVREQVGAAAAQPDDRVLTWLLRPAEWLALAWWRRLTGVAWLAAWLTAGLGLWQRPWRRVAAVAGVACVACAVGWGANVLGQRLKPRAIVVAAVAPLRTGPGPDYLLTYSLPDGAECTLLTRHAGWVQLQLRDGATGWTEAERVLALPLGLPRPGRAPTRWNSPT